MTQAAESGKANGAKQMTRALAKNVGGGVASGVAWRRNVISEAAETYQTQRHRGIARSQNARIWHNAARRSAPRMRKRRRAACEEMATGEAW